MRRFFVLTAGVFIFAYPFAIYFGISYFSPRYLALGFGFVFILRFALSIKQRQMLLLSIGGMVISLIGILTNQEIIIKLYPVLINLSLYLLFFYSLFRPRSMIENLARIRTPNLSQAAINYTRKLTKIWCIFFIINGGIALWTAFCTPVKIWAFYNGFLSYIFIGILFVSEFIYRQYARRKNYI